MVKKKEIKPIMIETIEIVGRAMADVDFGVARLGLLWPPGCYRASLRYLDGSFCCWTL